MRAGSRAHGRRAPRPPLPRRFAGAPGRPPEGAERPRAEAYRAQKGGRLPRGIFMHIIGYWRSSRDYCRQD